MFYRSYNHTFALCIIRRSPLDWKSKEKQMLERNWYCMMKKKQDRVNGSLSTYNVQNFWKSQDTTEKKSTLSISNDENYSKGVKRGRLDKSINIILTQIGFAWRIWEWLACKNALISAGLILQMTSVSYFKTTCNKWGHQVFINMCTGRWSREIPLAVRYHHQGIMTRNWFNRGIVAMIFRTPRMTDCTITQLHALTNTAGELMSISGLYSEGMARPTNSIWNPIYYAENDPIVWEILQLRQV